MNETYECQACGETVKVIDQPSHWTAKHVEGAQIMDDDRFFGDVALLTEASRLNPIFAAKVEEAGTDEQVDALVEEARRIVEQATAYDF